MRRSYKAPTCSYSDLPLPKKNSRITSILLTFRRLLSLISAYIMKDSSKSCSQPVMNKPTDANDDKPSLLMCSAYIRSALHSFVTSYTAAVLGFFSHAMLLLCMLFYLVGLVIFMSYFLTFVFILLSSDFNVWYTIWHVSGASRPLSFVNK